MDTIVFTLLIGAIVAYFYKFIFSRHHSSASEKVAAIQKKSDQVLPQQTHKIAATQNTSQSTAATVPAPITAPEKDDCEGEGCGTSCTCKSEDNGTSCGTSESCGSCGTSDTCGSPATPVEKEKAVKILYGTQTGTTKLYAEKLAAQAKERDFAKVEVGDLSQYDLDELSDEVLVVFLVSTYTGGTPPENCVAFFDWLDAHSLDWRVDKASFENVHFAVFGIGNSVYGENFNVAAKKLDDIMARLTARRVTPVGLGDNGAGFEIADAFAGWSAKFWKALFSGETKKSPSPKTKRVRKVRPPKVSDEPDEDPIDELAGEPLVDLEDLGTMIKPPPKIKKRSNRKQVKKDVPAAGSDSESSEEDEPLDPTKGPREMLTPSLRQALTKQGYRLLGSHSGVKMCRWTKAMLRGRGGCYKHTFYGIKSYQCMEMTPSLACANKCVFCWRHHKNPVGTEWKWKTDAAEFLIDEAMKNHQQMIKQMKGVPGVLKERYDEAFTIKHCALSLVGEPITYPEINKFVDLLHEKGISSFMVTNAQFPDKIDELKPVTQLYISVDAATPESLKRIDRPIFPDFWERFVGSMDSLAKKGQRTVYRLTLVKEWNMDELKDYAALIKRGEPSFVEVKGVTWCGTSKASTLTMQNVPFHEEVIKFALALCALPELAENYELCVEHEHSCAVLIAHKKFKVDGVWNTWIDYPKFHALASSGEQFSAVDYMEPTPSWALVGSQERGFDPEETRFRRNKPYQGSGC